MDSIKDILNQLKKDNEQEVDEKQPSLIDTQQLATNPNKLFGNKHKYVTTEYQVYGLRLAGKLGDKKRATMYIKWAKEKPRAILEMAYSFAIDYPNAKDRSRIFMWKVKELENERKEGKIQEDTK
ncbi:MAG TPA: hypothetical protein PKW94_00675 [Candidatus Dojkabacteria bacterium]|jgi:hypothetical protein|nr:hypothetical protein [Candidatus Dojkabacteria bacterium]HOR06149.1 hypothetical protein [Candidatus Dojkabacteria bacterium]HOT60803.1 hypothetical protein [Candidatus Dojkabacteria bacterium]HQI92703.1 hypothetical protein [Candidatus Dojkabacteria bacterium]